MPKTHDLTHGTVRRPTGSPNKGEPVQLVAILEKGKVGELGPKAFTEIRFWNAEDLLKVLHKLEIPETHELKRVQYAEQMLGIQMVQMPGADPGNVVLLLGPGFRGHPGKLLVAVKTTTMNAVISYLPEWLAVRAASEGIPLDASIVPGLK